MGLRLVEHSSPKYTPRTYLNANSADLTAAFAVDFNTAGEKCTHKAAGDAYIDLPLQWQSIDVARRLYKAVRDINKPVLNVAGNGIYTLALHGWTQEGINQYVYDVLRRVHYHKPLEKVISGGQTGVDIAGIVAACALGIDAVATFPKGYLQRGTDKVDRNMNPNEIRGNIGAWVIQLKKERK